MRLRQADLTWQQLDDEVVILDLRASSYLKLNGTGALLWRGLAAGAEDEQLTDSLVQEYDVPREQADRDVRAFISQLEGAGLLEAANDG